MISFLIFLSLSFLLGSIPSGYLVGKALGKDIRKEGSGNTGATNAARTLGKKAGIITLVVDLVKGAIPPILPVFFSVGQLQWGSVSSEALGSVQAVLGFAAILGHCYSPFLMFKGGKGVATSLGMFLVVAPIEALVCLGLFALIVKKTNYVSLASTSSMAIFAILILLRIFDSHEGLTALIAIATATLVISRHRENIGRLLDGTEAKFSSTPKA